MNKQNNNLMEQIQNNLNAVSKQLNDLKLIEKQVVRIIQLQITKIDTMRAKQIKYTHYIFMYFLYCECYSYKI